MGDFGIKADNTELLRSRKISRYFEMKGRKYGLIAGIQELEQNIERHKQEHDSVEKNLESLKAELIADGVDPKDL